MMLKIKINSPYHIDKQLPRRSFFLFQEKKRNNFDATKGSMYDNFTVEFKIKFYQRTKDNITTTTTTTT